MRYSLFRISLAEREIPGLLRQMGLPEKPARTDFLRQTFTENLEFAHRKTVFTYVFIGQEDEYVLGRIGRKVRETTSTGPEQKLTEQYEDLWKAANIIIDIQSRDDGQILAFQNVNVLGQPHAVCDSLASHINNFSVDWLMSIHPLIDSKDFWEVAKNHKGEITDLELNFVAPNIFGGRDKTRNALRRLRDKNRAQSLTAKITNREGALDPDSDEIRESIDYISEGGGSVKLKAGKKKLYDSDEHAIGSEVEDEDDFAISESNKSLWNRLIARVFKQ